MRMVNGVDVLGASGHKNQVRGSSGLIPTFGTLGFALR
jgi:hypothetical protein